MELAKTLLSKSGLQLIYRGNLYTLDQFKCIIDESMIDYPCPHCGYGEFSHVILFGENIYVYISEWSGCLSYSPDYDLYMTNNFDELVRECNLKEETQKKLRSSTII